MKTATPCGKIHIEVDNMSEKWAVAFECDLSKGVCVLAKKNAGEGEVALFDS